MPGADYAEVSRRLRDAGQPDDLTCVIVSNATNAQQQICWTNVAGLASAAKLAAPALLIVGRVATQQVEEIAATRWRPEPSERQSKHPTIS